MILYYAIGGGLGHLTRARAVLHTLGITGRVAVITASHLAEDPRINRGLDIISVPPELANDGNAYRTWLNTMLAELSPDEIYLDTFPAGILGEFCDLVLPGNARCHYISRLLRWDRYEQVLHGRPPCFQRAYLLEPIAPRHEEYIHDHSIETHDLRLIDPPVASTEELEYARRWMSELERPLWLVIHSGPESEVIELLDYADEMREMEQCAAQIVLVSPVASIALPSETIHLDIYPAEPLFPLADRMITGCGFNVMRQTEAYRDRHRFIPFPRRYDDQFLRAARRRKKEIGF